MDNSISFPGLGQLFNIDPVAFNLLGKDIYWYGIIIAVGFLLAVIFAHYEAKRIGMNPDYISDLLIWVTPIAIIGARLYYVIFKWSDYKNDLAEIYKIWNGGIAIYGAIIASVITTVIFCRKKRISMGQIFDIGAMGLLIGQSIGRWGNFVNKEAFGYETSLPWRMEIYSKEAQKVVAVHPTFLYESLWNAIGFFILLSLRKKKPFEGFVFFAYLTWYGLGRLWIEGLRTDSLMLGNLRISQFVALICIIGGLWAIKIGLKAVKEKNKEKYIPMLEQDEVLEETNLIENEAPESHKEDNETKADGE